MTFTARLKAVPFFRESFRSHDLQLPGAHGRFDLFWRVGQFFGEVNQLSCVST